MGISRKTKENADQSCELNVRYTRTYSEKVFPSPIMCINSSLKRSKSASKLFPSRDRNLQQYAPIWQFVTFEIKRSNPYIFNRRSSRTGTCEKMAATCRTSRGSQESHCSTNRFMVSLRRGPIYWGNLSCPAWSCPLRCINTIKH